MNDHDLNESCRDAIDRALVQRVLRRILIHDLLPFGEHEPGLSIREIQRELADLGFKVGIRSLQRELDDMAELFWVEKAGTKGRSAFWKKLRDENLADHVRPLACMARGRMHSDQESGQRKVGARHSQECPDFNSDIEVKRNT